MTTEAGKRLLSIGGEFRWPRPDYAVADAIDAIEAEAAAAERSRITEAVGAMFGQVHPMAAIEDEPTRHDVVSRKAVLAIVEEP